MKRLLPKLYIRRRKFFYFLKKTCAPNYIQLVRTILFLNKTEHSLMPIFNVIDFWKKLNANTIFVFNFVHNKGAFEGAEMFDGAENIKHKFLIIFHVGGMNL